MIVKKVSGYKLPPFIIFICVVNFASAQIDTTNAILTDLQIESDSIPIIKAPSLIDYFSNSSTEIRASYTYGIPVQIDQNGEINNYQLDLRTGVDIMNLPFTLVGSYSSVTPYSGFGSYFKIDLDVSELKRRKELLNGKIIDSLADEIGKLDKKIFELESKLLFLKDSYSKFQAKNFNIDRYKNSIGRYKDQIPDTSMAGMNSLDKPGEISRNLNTDSIVASDSTENWLNINKLRDSFKQKVKISNPTESIYEYWDGDSVAQLKRSKVEALAQRLNQIKEDRALIEGKIVTIQEYGEDLGIFSENLKSSIGSIVKKVIVNAKRFEVGLARPNNSKFLIHGLPMLGIHLESQIQRYYLSASGGRIYNPRTYGYITRDENHKITNILGLPSESLKYDAIQFKAGLGGINESHLHVGWLGAKSANLPKQESHSVFEIDTRLLHKGIKLDLTGALSKNNTSQKIMPGQDFIIATESSLKERIAGKGDLRIPIKLTRTDLSARLDFTGSSFFSPGLGYQRAGLLTYKGEIKQSIGKKTKLSVFYLRETDGLLLNQLTYTVFERWGIEIRQKIGRSFEVFAQFSPISQQLLLERKTLNETGVINASELDSIVAMRDLTSSYLLNGGLNWSRRFGEVTLNSYNLVQYYSLSIPNEQSQECYTLLSNSFSVDISGKIQIALNATTILPESDQSTFSSSTTYNLNLINSLSKKFSFSGEGIVLNENGALYIGYGLGMKLQVSKKLGAEVNARKLVNDTYSEEFYATRYGMDIPYQITTSLIWKL